MPKAKVKKLKHPKEGTTIAAMDASLAAERKRHEVRERKALASIPPTSRVRGEGECTFNCEECRRNWYDEENYGAWIPACCHACNMSVYFNTLRAANAYKRANPTNDNAS